MSRRSPCLFSRHASAGGAASATPGSGSLPETRTASKKVVLVVIDGLTAAMFESTAERKTPALAYLGENGRYSRAVSTFPSLTPVCLSSIATGSGPEIHHIPHLVWWHRGEQRLVADRAPVFR